MEYMKSQKYNKPEILAKIMGPNPLKLQEEMLQNHKIPAGSRVCDLGSGQGLTSVMLVKDYGFTVYAADLWSEPEDNRKFFDEMGLIHEQIIPVKVDATALPFKKSFLTRLSARIPTIIGGAIQNIWTQSCCLSSKTAVIFTSAFPA